LGQEPAAVAMVRGTLLIHFSSCPTWRCKNHLRLIVAPRANTQTRLTAYVTSQHRAHWALLQQRPSERRIDV
jgi:hypothetical protein